jgi:hypothetical protein
MTVRCQELFPKQGILFLGGRRKKAGTIPATGSFSANARPAPHENGKGRVLPPHSILWR